MRPLSVRAAIRSYSDFELGDVMDKPAFTPGPWQIPERFHKDDELEIIGNIDGVDGDYGTTRVIFTSVARLYDNDEQAANARLIAAAPDMYEALKALAFFSGEISDKADQDRLTKMFAVGRAALAKVQS